MNELEFRAQAVLDHNMKIAYAVNEIRNKNEPLDRLNADLESTAQLLFALAENQQIYMERLEAALAETKKRKFFHRK